MYVSTIRGSPGVILTRGQRVLRLNEWKWEEGSFNKNRFTNMIFTGWIYCLITFCHTFSNTETKIFPNNIPEQNQKKGSRRMKPARERQRKILNENPVKDPFVWTLSNGSETQSIKKVSFRILVEACLLCIFVSTILTSPLSKHISTFPVGKSRKERERGRGL